MAERATGRIASLRCVPVDGDRVRACAYDLASRRAYRVSLRLIGGTWMPEEIPVPVLDGGGRDDGPGLCDAVSEAVAAWQAENRAALAEAGAMAVRIERTRAARRAESLLTSARGAERSAAKAGRDARTWARASERSLAGHTSDAPLTMEVRRGDRVATLVASCGDVPLVLAMPGTASVRSDGMIEPGRSTTDEVRAFVMEAARRRPDALMPLARMVAARIEEAGHVARATELRAQAERMVSAPEADEREEATGTFEGAERSGPSSERVPWHRCACLDGRTIRVVLHDVVRAAQVVAVADEVDGNWRIRPVKAVYPFAKRGRGGESCSDLDEAISGFALLHAQANAADLAGAAETVRLRGARRAPDPRLAEAVVLEAEASDLRARLAVLVDSLARRGRVPATLPFSGIVRSEGRAWRVSATPGAGHLTLRHEAPLPVDGMLLNPGYDFLPDGTLVGPDEDCHRLTDMGDAWAMWARTMARDAAVAMEEAVAGRLGVEIEAGIAEGRLAALEGRVADLRNGNGGQDGGNPEP